MTNEINAYKSAEAEAFGEFLIRAVADGIGCEPDIKRIEKAIYKGTDCGAWIKFDENGIMVGSIVEGSDAEFSERIDVSGTGDVDDPFQLISDRVFAALERINKAACEAWDEANSEENDE